MITEPYTLFTRIVLYRDRDGGLHAPRLWQRDIAHHLAYIADLRLCCPVAELPDSPHSELDLVPVPGLGLEQVVALRPDGGWGSVLINLLPNFLKVLNALRCTAVAHSSGAGWAFPLSYYILLARPFLDFRWIVLIESSPWMKTPGTRSPRRLLAHVLNRLLVRRCLEHADARVFTQAWYRDALLGTQERSLVSPAVWIDAGSLIPEEELEARSRRSGPVRAVFASRLVSEKGVAIVLEAAQMLNGRGVALEIEIIGSGPLEEECRKAAARIDGSVRLRLRQPVAYGEEFFTLLDRCEIALLANRQQEQPRILFDYFARGLACVATRTEGILGIARDGIEARLVPVDDAAAMSEALELLAADPAARGALAKAARNRAEGFTHRGMHAVRETFLRRTLSLA